VRLADAILRRGHLSERALAEVCITGERPIHLDRCDLCAERAVQLGRWLDDIRTVGIETADAAFPQERLAAQQAQILRRLEQLDHPARVITFPGQSRYSQPEIARRRSAPAWVGLGAAAGLVLGIVGGQIVGRLGQGEAVALEAAMTAASTAAAESPTMEASARVSAVDAGLVDPAGEWPSVPLLEALDQLTPHAVDLVIASSATSARGGRR